MTEKTTGSPSIECYEGAHEHCCCPGMCNCACHIKEPFALIDKGIPPTVHREVRLLKYVVQPQLGPQAPGAQRTGGAALHGRQRLEVITPQKR